MSTKGNSKPFFSIILPTKESSATLKTCLESIIQQVFKDLEIVVIDNNSVDSTYNIIKMYQDRASVKWYSENDNGVYDAMNKGIAYAEGEYLYFLGSDDSLYDKYVLQSVYDNLVRTKVDIIYGDVLMKTSNSHGVLHGGEFDLKRLMSDNICHQAIFYHAKVFKKVGTYNLKYRVLADYDFNLRCAAFYNFYYINLIVANFSLGGLSTQIKDELFIKDKDNNIVKYFLNKLHTKAFVDLRLYVQRGAFSESSNLSLLLRSYCLFVYAKLKMQSLFS